MTEPAESPRDGVAMKLYLLLKHVNRSAVASMFQRRHLTSLGRSMNERRVWVPG
jgi:hypothetical protein